MSQVTIVANWNRVSVSSFYKYQTFTINYVDITMQLIYCSTSIISIDVIFSRNLSISNVTFF